MPKLVITFGKSTRMNTLEIEEIDDDMVGSYVDYAIWRVLIKGVSQTIKKLLYSKRFEEMVQAEFKLIVDGQNGLSDELIEEINKLVEEGFDV